MWIWVVAIAVLGGDEESMLVTLMKCLSGGDMCI